MNPASIERALSLSDNNEYVAVERLSNGDFDSPYGDLLWVRGTNTSIFLSCYHEDGQWKLMAKGTQFRKGFVPMMETIDPGINAIFGVNYTSISGYPPSKITGSGEYATKPHNVIPFDVELAEQELRDILSGKEGLKDCSPILMAYRFL